MVVQLNGKRMPATRRWFTPTTKERLNALPDVNIVQRNFKWYLNGNLKPWDGKKIDVKLPF